LGTFFWPNVSPLGHLRLKNNLKLFLHAREGKILEGIWNKKWKIFHVVKEKRVPWWDYN